MATDDSTYESHLSPWSDSHRFIERQVFPDRGPSPVCLREGHKWSDPVSSGYASDVVVRGCERCAARGHFLAETRNLASL